MTIAPPPADGLARDGAQAAAEDFDLRVEEGEAAVRGFFNDHPGSSITLSELRRETTGGRSPSVMTTAFINLEDSGELQIDYVTSVATAQL